MSDASAVTKETVLKIAKLARIEISEKDIPPLVQEMCGILRWIECLNRVDTSSTPPLSTPLQELNISQPLRIDTVTDGNIVGKILSNAPEVALDMFVVPKVVE
ncbi:MAG: aspartyl/glutamyl-tRNA(Asn/Gln) amidotransferase subunit C [Alphaproteobacteria bacterium 16-39-46]|nr:MAG: aspartyl/glutamyl-tRNA(Asn/Gln) amidotransferase subunit C [Alphaproteobacteria bacterium 16-39-46]OZA41053.1 MAG: aspartyl/glutamyl-tRNA(Asn/Gln) amidotransferase subunit C [Alphaproteobacteria bacterium 17-39-52]HQS84931.1 Asp-tRNA(Asn)/Glu-tRNA(Gln) amidotransferase subunit GatC [Alphaproteobacteria bacterium]HQS94684.1 Asp-tRNA(Asn)/Glu-tRNA(Gln) amidotransferase subunit GatC [Alphaproteobacteria bacterium]